MAETTDLDQPGRSCPNCGAEIRQGNVFCTSCGTNLVPGNEVPEQTQAEASPEEASREDREEVKGAASYEPGDERGPDLPPSPSLKVGIADYAERFSGWFKRKIVEVGTKLGDPNHSWAGSARALGGLEDVLRSVVGRAVRWFKDLPTITTRVVAAVMVGLGVVVLLLLLNPVIYFVAGATLVVGVAALILRAIQRRPIWGWGIVAITSLVLMLLSGVIWSVYSSYAAEDASERAARMQRVEEDRELRTKLDSHFQFWAEAQN